MNRIAVVGGGTMGAAFVRAVVDAGVVEASALTICEVAAERRSWLEREFPGVEVTDDLAAAVERCETVLLALKPQDVGSMGDKVSFRDRLVISILAGYTFSQLGHLPRAKRLVRAMPNTPAQIGRGFTAWTATSDVSVEERAFVGKLLGAMGEQLYVADESVIDKVTAVSGSGPAYVFLFMEAMIDAAVTIGLRPDEARRMVLQTLIGSAEFARETGEHAAVLKDMVTSPGGTTAAGLSVLEQRAVRSALIDAIAAAHRRAEELGRS